MAVASVWQDGCRKKSKSEYTQFAKLLIRSIRIAKSNGVEVRNADSDPPYQIVTIRPELCFDVADYPGTQTETLNYNTYLYVIPRCLHSRPTLHAPAQGGPRYMGKWEAAQRLDASNAESRGSTWVPGEWSYLAVACAPSANIMLT